jgi:uncharacterized protein (DUF952 family)
MSFAGKGMIALSKISQAQKAKNHVFSHRQDLYLKMKGIKI